MLLTLRILLLICCVILTAFFSTFFLQTHFPDALELVNVFTAVHEITKQFYRPVWKSTVLGCFGCDVPSSEHSF